MSYHDPRRPRRDPNPRQKKNGFWYLVFYMRGKTPREKWVATGIQTRYSSNWKAHVPEDVNRSAVEWGRLWRDGRYDPWQDSAPGMVSVQEAIKRYLDARDITESTRKSYRTTLDKFAETLSPNFPVSDVQPHHIRRFLTQPHLKGSTPAAYHNRFRTFFGYCLDRHWIYEDPTKAVEKPSEASAEPREIFLPREFEAILRAADADAVLNPERRIVLDAYEFAVVTGMRRQELCSRTWGDVDLARNRIRVDDQPLCGFTPKNVHSRRNVPLWPRAKMVLERRREQRISDDLNEPIFLAPRHTSSDNPFLSDDWLSRRFTEHREQAGFRHGTIHTTRATAITWWLCVNLPETQVMKMVGHVKSSTMLRYARMVDELLQDAITDALARYLPDYEDEEPVLVREIMLFLNGQELPERTLE